jgi:hypothetical protein
MQCAGGCEGALEVQYIDEQGQGKGRPTWYAMEGVMGEAAGNPLQEAQAVVVVL